MKDGEVGWRAINSMPLNPTPRINFDPSKMHDSYWGERFRSASSSAKLWARLDNKTGHNVICGVKRCDGQFADIVHLEQDKGLGPQLSPTIRAMQFLSGWAPRRDGVWGFLNYAKRRQNRGRQPKVRRYPHDTALLFSNKLRNGNAVMDSFLEELPLKRSAGSAVFCT